jgi:hypothetical protein
MPVADQDFFFALDLSDEPHFDRMLSALSDTVLRFVGYDAPAVDAVTAQVKTALADGVSRGRERCDVRFRASDGKLQISVAYPGGPTWELTRALPAPS